VTVAAFVALVAVLVWVVVVVAALMYKTGLKQE